MNERRNSPWDRVVDAWIKVQANDVAVSQRPVIEGLLNVSVGRVLKAEFAGTDGGVSRPDARRIQYLSETYGNDVEHICDWLVGAVLRDDPWLARLNSDGVPLKLAKAGRLRQIVDEANKAMRRLNSRGVKGNSGGETVHEFENGYSIVRLTTTGQLEDESAMMQHCVGQGAYHQRVMDETTAIFSLRDPAGKAHATIEIDLKNGSVEQVKGKQNVIPRMDYFSLVATWLNTQKYKYDCDDLPIGYAADSVGKLVNLATLPDGAVFDGELSFDISDDGAMPPLPENLTVKGDLRICGTKSVRLRLPKGLTVEGNYSISGIRITQEGPFPGSAVYLNSCTIEALPSLISQSITITISDFVEEFSQGTIFEQLVCLSATRISEQALGMMQFCGNLHIDNAICLSIPDGFNVRGDLKITRSTVFFQGAVEVGKSMVLNDSPVEGTPLQLSVGSSFHAHRSKILMLPDDTTIGGDLTLTSVKLMSTLPGSARIGGKITIDDAPIQSLEGRKLFHGDLSLYRTEVDTLEPGTIIMGSLRVGHLPMQRLPVDLSVQDDLTIGPCQIKRIPRSTRIGGNLDLTGSYVDAVPENFQLPGNLDISDLGWFRIPPGVRIGGSLFATRTGIEELPSGLEVNAIHASGSRLVRLPRQLAVDGHLDVSDTLISMVPEDLWVGGRASFTNTPIREVPASVFVGEELRVDDGVIIHAYTPEQERSLRFG